MLPLTWNSWCELPPVHPYSLSGALSIRVLVDSDPIILNLSRSSGNLEAGARAQSRYAILIRVPEVFLPSSASFIPYISCVIVNI
jgi:hypothetical protein